MNLSDDRHDRDAVQLMIHWVPFCGHVMDTKSPMILSLHDRTPLQLMIQIGYVSSQSIFPIDGVHSVFLSMTQVVLSLIDVHDVSAIVTVVKYKKATRRLIDLPFICKKKVYKFSNR